MEKPVVYSKPDCSNCEATKGLMDILNVEYDVVDISVDRDALKRIKSLGYRVAPVVEIPGVESWSGFDRDKIMKHFGADSALNDDDTWDF